MFSENRQKGQERIDADVQSHILKSLLGTVSDLRVDIRISKRQKLRICVIRQ